MDTQQKTPPRFEWTDSLAMEFAAYVLQNWEQNGETTMREFKAMKTQTALFRTMDGVDIRPGEKFWQVDNAWFAFERTANFAIYADPPNTFSSKRAAEEWISHNKKMYSLMDIREAFSENASGSAYDLAVGLERLTKRKNDATATDKVAS